MAKAKKITKVDMMRVEKYFNTNGFYNRFRRMAKFIIPFKKEITFNLNVGGGSFTDGNSITVGLPDFVVNNPKEEQFLILKALVGHESEHIVSSDFRVFKEFQYKVNEFFKANYGVSGGTRVGANMLNAVEDGRIEKRLVNRLQGMKKNIQFMNSVFWEKLPCTKENELFEYILNVCSIATSGILKKDFDKVYGGTQMETEINKIKPLIIKAINEPTAQGCADRVFEIIEMNADFIAGMMADEAVDELDSNPEYTTTPQKSSDKEKVCNSESSHFKPEEENSKEPKEESKDDSEKGEDGENSSDGDSETGEDGKDEKAGDGDDSKESKQDSDDDMSGSGDSADGDSEEDEDGKAKASDNSKPSKSKSKSDIEGEVDSDVSSSEDTNEEGPSGKGMTDKELVKQAIRAVEEILSDEADSDIKQSHREDKQSAIRDAKMKASEDKIALSESELAGILEDKALGVEACGYELYEDTKYTSTLTPELKQKGFKFAKDVEKIFKNKEGFNLKNKRNGILDPNALWRMTAGDTDIFNRKGNPIESDYAVSVLVDNSGSMSGGENGKRKMDSAIEACIIMEEGLKGVLPLAITRFDEQAERVIHNRIRTFDDNSKENQSSRIGRHTGAGNFDGFSIMIATAELEKRVEKQKLLLILSDGEPAYYQGRTAGVNHVKKAVDEARKKGIKVVAIRFGNAGHLASTASSYKEMYDHSFISCVSEDIQKELVKQLKKTLK